MVFILRLAYRSPNGLYRYDGIIAEANVVYILPNQSTGIVIGNNAQGEILTPPNIQFEVTSVESITKENRASLSASNPLYVDSSDQLFQYVPDHTIVIYLRELP